MLTTDETGPDGGQPLVSGLMVTAGRTRLAERAVRCFCQQTWPNRELVIVDDGPEDYGPMLQRYAGRGALRYLRIPRQPGRMLGGLRNMSLDEAHGDYCMQWDDDEWYHPQRIEAQMRALEGGFGASVLRGTLMHLDTPEFVDHAFRTGLRRGTPGTILHRRTSSRYPNRARGEDSMYLRELRQEMPVRILGPELSHLFIRCFHGANTWDRRHFAERLHYTARDTAQYLWARYLKRDLFSHPAFRLTVEEQASVRSFLAESRELGLL